VLRQRKDGSLPCRKRSCLVQFVDSNRKRRRRVNPWRGELIKPLKEECCYRGTNTSARRPGEKRKEKGEGKSLQGKVDFRLKEKRKHIQERGLVFFLEGRGGCPSVEKKFPSKIIQPKIKYRGGGEQTF